MNANCNGTNRNFMKDKKSGAKFINPNTNAISPNVTKLKKKLYANLKVQSYKLLLFRNKFVSKTAFFDRFV